MREIVECVANVSEGREKSLLDEMGRRLIAVPETHLLDTSIDADHNRTVLTFISSPQRIVEAALVLIATAVDGIDMRERDGVHPAIGAADVVPLIPIRGISMQRCVKLARRLGRLAAERHSLPVYLYEEAARTASRRHLPQIRRGGLGKLKETITDPERHPDFGPARLHPTAGATVVGARRALIALNIFLQTPRVATARRIAARIRESNGGLPSVRALGFPIDARGQAQVSMNLTDYRQTSPIRVFREVRRLASELDTEVASTELIGLVPRAALDADDAREMNLEDFNESRILENRIAVALGE